MTSAPATASSTEVVARTPRRSMSGSISVDRSARADLRAEDPQQPQVRPEHPAVQQVAMMETLSPANPPLRLPDRERVDQSLGRMLVHAVPGIDDAGPHRRAARCPAPADACRRTIMSGDIASRLRSVFGQGLALRNARSAGRDVHGVGAEPLLGDLERGSGPGARLEEEIHHRVPAQGRPPLDRPRADLLHGLRGIENQQDFVGRQIPDAQQVLRPEADRRVEPQRRIGGAAGGFSGRGHRG